MKKPFISVIMAVYNTPYEYLKASINSILQQTYSNFEFLIIDDYSDLKTQEALSTFSDPRIKILRNESNIGLTKSLNIAIRQCHGEYIARMDSDDISLPDRFQKQVAYMENNPSIGVCGTLAKIFGANLNYQTYWNNSWQVRRVRMLFYNTGIIHPTAFIRKSVLDDYHILYRENIKKAQDYALWADLIHVTDIQLLKETLFHYRMHDGQITRTSHSQQIEYEFQTIKCHLVPFHLSDDEVSLLCHFYRGDADDISKMIIALQHLESKNSILKLYEQSTLQQQITTIYFQSALKRLLRLKKIDMILNPFMLRIFIPTHLYAIAHYVLKEKLRG